jgi:prepilin-type N-terminal cleavage/methylation domain-containing protein
MLSASIAAATCDEGNPDMHRQGRTQRDDRGFTLIELLIVIVILGILAAIVVFAVGNTGQKSASAACNADAKSVETALEAFKAQNNSTYPTPNADQSAGAWSPLTATGASGAPFLRSRPGSAHYTIWWDSNGAVWVDNKSATALDTSAGHAENFDTTTTACSDKAS